MRALSGLLNSFLGIFKALRGAFGNDERFADGGIDGVTTGGGFGPEFDVMAHKKFPAQGSFHPGDVDGIHAVVSDFVTQKPVLVLYIDTSKSIGRIYKQFYRQLRQAMNHIRDGRREAHMKLVVITFNSEIECIYGGSLAEWPGFDLAELEPGNKRCILRGGTSLYRAWKHAAEVLRDLPPKSNIRVVMISDGLNNAVDGARLDDAVRAVERLVQRGITVTYLYVENPGFPKTGVEKIIAALHGAMGDSTGSEAAIVPLERLAEVLTERGTDMA